MAEVRILFQEFFSAPGMKQVSFGHTYIEINSATSDHLVLPRNLIDVQMHSETLGQVLPVFYQYGTLSGNRLAIDGSTVGNRYWVCSKHYGIVNEGDLTP